MAGDLVDNVQAAEKALLEHCGYAHDWRIFPLDDNRSMYWAVDREECEWIRWSPKREAIIAWVQDARGDFPEEFGDKCFSGEIYTYRHLKKWVYRGSKFTLVLTDTHCDGNILLMIFCTDKEIKY